MTREQAPAKLNLALDIIGQRGDGYHNLRMIMQSVSLVDTLALEEQGEGFSLILSCAPFSTEKKTLEERAAEAFFAAAGLPMPGLRVTLDKRIPAFAGLGGGSADVAALLRLLQARYCPEMSMEEVERIGLTVGSDMPFCVRGGTALAEGRGEILTPLPPLPPCFFVMCKPGFDLPTAALFARADRISIRRRPDVDGMAAAIRRGDAAGVAQRFCNVFEEALPEDRRDDVFSLKAALMENGALNASMSGSGPAVFGMFLEEEAARRAAENLRKNCPEVFMARPVERYA